MGNGMKCNICTYRLLLRVFLDLPRWELIPTVRIINRLLCISVLHLSTYHPVQSMTLP